MISVALTSLEKKFLFMIYQYLFVHVLKGNLCLGGRDLGNMHTSQEVPHGINAEATTSFELFDLFSRSNNSHLQYGGSGS